MGLGWLDRWEGFGEVRERVVGSCRGLECWICRCGLFVGVGGVGVVGKCIEGFRGWGIVGGSWSTAAAAAAPAVVLVGSE